MLEFKILKVKHSTEVEARKLLPYIQNTNVYSMESPMTEDSARFHEDDWQKMLSEKWSRSMFERVTRHVMKEPDPEIFAYSFTSRSYAFRQKIPILFLERHSPEDLDEIRRLLNKCHLLTEDAVNLLGTGKINEFLNRQWKGIQAQFASVEIRDRNIGHNIDRAEQLIRERYKGLKDKDPLRLTLAIGSVHAPEKYTSIPVSIHYLRGEAKDPTERLAYALESMKSFEELTPLILSYGAQQLINLGRIPLTLNELEKMTTEELRKRLELVN